jgi:TolB-like protein
MSLFTTLILFSVLVFSGSTVLDDPKTKLAEAEKLYNSAQFDDAIEILVQLANDGTIDKEIQKDALCFLGRAYTAKGLYEDAKTAITKLLKLEPPMVVFNPDYEPPVFMKLYYESRKEITGTYALEREDPGMKNLAVIDFKNRSITNREQFDPMEKGFADLLINRLNNSTNLRVVERERIQWILDEIKLQNQYEMEGAVRLGKQLGVQSVLMGSFMVNENNIWLGARLVKVETSEILLAEEIKGDLDEFFDLVDQLSVKISEKINTTLNDLTPEDQAKAPSLDAIMSYSIGLSYLEQEDYKMAYEKFNEALKYDPGYEKAKLKAQSIAPLQ